MRIKNMHSWAAFWFCVLTISFVNGQSKYKVCSRISNQQDCDQLVRHDTVHCNSNAHSVDCLINIDEGRTDFGRVTAEEALLAAPLTNNVVVVGEFRSEAIFDDSNYATVVLVQRNYSGGFQNFKGKKYCHPGFKYDPTVTDFLLKQFENKVLKENNAQGCTNSVETGTLLEKELKSVADFFGPSCRPGPWIDMEDINLKYYSKYSKLCQLCSGSNNRCDSPVGAAPFIQSLDCLVQRGGDVSLSSLNSVYEYFNRSENVLKQAEYGYLCFDGTVQSLDNPCVWSKQPWDLLVAHKDRGSELKSDFANEWFPKDIIQSLSIKNNDQILNDFLKPIINPLGNGVKLRDYTKPLKDYIEEYRVIPSAIDSEKCRQNVRWCTASKEEQSKCQWLVQASLNRAIQPVISCAQTRDNKFSCLEDIQRGSADVVTSDAHYGYIARKKKLAPIAYPETFDSYDLIKAIVVIKNGDSNIQRFGNLKNKKACIPEYGGVEWLSFINTARQHGVMSKKICDYGELISDFVSEACVPGALDNEHEKSATTDHEKLCLMCVPSENYTLTHTICNANQNNKYYGSEGALKCLEGGGDFAVVTKKEYLNFKSDNFRVLCKNGSLAAHTGFNVNDDCTLATIVDSEVVTKSNSSKINDISVLLLNFEKRFGTDRTKAFEIFNTFNGTKDLLFKDTTRGLAKVTSTNQYILKYLKLFEHVDECVRTDGKGGSVIVEPTMFCIILSCIVIFLRQ